MRATVWRPGRVAAHSNEECVGSKNSQVDDGQGEHLAESGTVKAARGGAWDEK